jgi:hypothetical protein
VIALVVGLATLVVVVLGDLLKVVVAGEVRGALADCCRRKLDRAASLLPPEIADDLAAEWLAELEAFEAADRLVAAWRFARSLPRASRQMAELPRGWSPRQLARARPVAEPRPYRGPTAFGIILDRMLLLAALVCGAQGMSSDSAPLIAVFVVIAARTLLLELRR